MSNKKRIIQLILRIFVVFTGLISIEIYGESTVKVWEEPLIIPTYRVEAPELNPMFYKGDAYQGAKKTVYPYPMIDNLTDRKEDKTYNAIYLENEYLKISVLPELGGRIFSGIDKANNYDFFYHQHVIKPALIGMLGAWISGGVEWCIPHHHRATTFMMVDYTLVDNEDGSKTIWVGEVELRHRMKWLVGMTLYKDKSYIEVTIKLFNRTPKANSFLYWANVAVHANPEYQIIFPPGTEYATYHAKNDFSHWPISNEIYQGVDYKGVDLSWWKNHPEPNSFFAWNVNMDFFAGYDHGERAGLVYVANHHIAPGKKLWEWGPGLRGRMWDKILTDADGPYTELMAGAYSDNQPDYSWIKPYEVKTVKQYWYPIREIGGVKNANLKAAVNLELTQDNIVKIGFNTTSEFRDATILLTAGDKVILRKVIDISPNKPFYEEIHLSYNVRETDLEALLFSSENEKLVSYRPAKQIYNPELPEVVKPPPTPEKIKTVEELYLAGLRLLQFHNPILSPIPYFEEALRRDPENSRVNIICGIEDKRRGLYKKASDKFRKAIKRISKDYTRSKDTEAYYNLGLVLKAQGKYDAAYDTLYRATWDYEFNSASYYQLAEIACIKGDFEQALSHINNSLSTNILNTRALNLKSAILRRLGKYKEAEKIASGVLTIDPLDFFGVNELYLAKLGRGLEKEALKELDELKLKMRNYVQSYLELAVDYSNINFWDESIEVLSRLDISDDGKDSEYPMIYYYLGYFYEKKGDIDKASKYYRLANEMPPEYCFPFRLESINILISAIKNNPDDSRAYYYLGSLLYDIQPENAIKQWEKSVTLDSTFSTSHRNLGWGYYRAQNDIPKAIVSYEKAIACNKRDPRLYYELDLLYELGGTSPGKRLKILEDNHEIIVKRDDSYSRETILCVQLGKYDKAINLLDNRHFHSWEGGGQIHNVYVDAHLLRGMKKFKEGRYKEALIDYKAASEYPENLEVGRPKNDRRAPQVHYYIGTAYEALGYLGNAKEFYKRSAEQKYTSQWYETQYYQGLAYRALGQEEKSKQIFNKLIKHGQDMLKESITMDFFAKFGERETKEVRMASAHYIIGLGYLGSGVEKKAKEEFEKALDLNVNHLWAGVKLSEID